MGEAPYCSMHNRYLRGGQCVDCKALLDRLETAERERDELRAKLAQLEREYECVACTHLRAKLAVARAWLQRAQMFAPEFARGALAQLDGDVASGTIPGPDVDP